MKHFATIELSTDADGLVFAELYEPRGGARYRSGRFATADAVLHALSPLVAELRKGGRERIGCSEVP